MGGGSSREKFPEPDMALQEAAKQGDVDACKKALENGAKINGMSPEPALIVAAWWGQHAVIKWMFTLQDEPHEIDLDIRSPKLVKGGNLMHACVGRNHIDAFNVICESSLAGQTLMHAKDSDTHDPYMVIGKFADRKQSGKDLTAAMKDAFMHLRGNKG
jgi:hypothetical protein